MIYKTTNTKQNKSLKQPNTPQKKSIPPPINPNIPIIPPSTHLPITQNTFTYPPLRKISFADLRFVSIREIRGPNT